MNCSDTDLYNGFRQTLEKAKQLVWYVYCHLVLSQVLFCWIKQYGWEENHVVSHIGSEAPSGICPASRVYCKGRCFWGISRRFIFALFLFPTAEGKSFTNSNAIFWSILILKQVPGHEILYVNHAAQSWWSIFAYALQANHCLIDPTKVLQSQENWQVFKSLNLQVKCS